MRLTGFAFSVAAAVGLAAASVAFAGPMEDGNAGLDALKAGDYAKAVTLFTRALASGKLAHDDKEFAYGQRGAANLKLGKTAAAILDFKNALKLNPDDEEAQAGLAEAQSQGAASQRAAAPASGGMKPEQAAQAGMEAMSTGDYARAILLFTRAIDSGALNGDDKELAYLTRGKAYSQKGDYRNGIADLNRAMHLKPDDQEAQEAFGKALGHIQAPTSVPGIDNPTCTKNFSTVGSVISGKSYTSFAEYPLPQLDIFAGLYAAIGVYTPTPGQVWQITAADLNAGTINANITYPDSPRQITLEARIETTATGSKVTLKETVPALMVTLDLKGSLCHTLSDAAKG
jgi:tetratricopeptide (TPR) repeat protein